jgi:lipid II isoglutaminyl synthase (glutamine-hydrolysing)
VLLLGRVFGQRGSSFPGLVVEKLYPGFLPAALQQLPNGVILVSGTNGKTTTVKMISEIIASSQPVLTNRTGANFTRGIISSIVSEASWRGLIPATIAVLEVDEAWAAKLVRQLRPRGVVITNVMRDQLDRFGEIDHTARLLGEVVAAATDFVVLNADDPRVARMAERATCPVTYFGVGQGLRGVFINDDELYSDHLDVAARLSERPEPQFVLEAVRPGAIAVSTAGVRRDLALPVYGSHNALNATAALAVGDRAGVPLDAAATALRNLEAAFGRGEFIDLDGHRLLLQLVKNPGGFRYSLMDVAGIEPAEILIAINDEYADGRDVSWLWDVDFRPLSAWPVYTTGTRAEDMALRLAYDGVVVRDCTPDMRAAVKRLAQTNPPGSVLVVCATYTAMFGMRAILGTMTEVSKV